MVMRASTRRPKSSFPRTTLRGLSTDAKAAASTAAKSSSPPRYLRVLDILVYGGLAATAGLALNFALAFPEPLPDVLEVARTDERVVAALGEPIDRSWLWSGDAVTTSVRAVVQLKGPRGEGTLNVRAVRVPSAALEDNSDGQEAVVDDKASEEEEESWKVFVGEVLVTDGPYAGENINLLVPPELRRPLMPPVQAQPVPQQEQAE